MRATRPRTRPTPPSSDNASLTFGVGALGLKWDEVGAEKLVNGKKLTNEKLAEALKSKTAFAPAEWEEVWHQRSD
eukprot:175077-Prymnesium_polylepis.2